MPRYKVIAPGFYNDLFYSPEGKRPYLNTAKPFTKKNPMPSWLTDMPKESAGLKAKREAYEKAQADLNAAKAEADAEDIKNASTEGEGEAVSFLDKAKDFVNGGSSKNVETI